MKTILFASVLLGLMSCRSSKIEGDGTNQTIQSKPGREKMAVLGYSKIPSDSLQAVKIGKVSIDGNVMCIDVTYSGGCEQHSFALEGHEAVAKSMPPIRTIRLVHTGKKDNCKAMVMQTLKFNITELAYTKEKGNQIYLKLEGYEGQNVLYTFP